MTPADLLDQLMRRDGARPLLTWYDDSSGERIELSVATSANWAAKTANLLVDEHGLEPGDGVSIEPPGHWLAAVVVLGAWTAGVAIDLRPDSGLLQLPSNPARFMREVLPQPDALLVSPAAPTDIAIRAKDRELSLDELVKAAGTPPRAVRLMSTLPLDSVDGLLAGLVTPLVADGSSVLVTAADHDRLPSRAEAERVTHTVGVALAGLPTLVNR